MKTILPILILLSVLFGWHEGGAQTLSFNPQLPDSTGKQVNAAVGGTRRLYAASTAELSDYAGTYVGVVIYYDINTGVGDWELVFEADGTIRLSDKFQAKYPNAHVSGTFKRNGKFKYVNQQTDGLTFTTTGRISIALEKFTATFTSTSAGTGSLVCNKL